MRETQSPSRALGLCTRQQARRRGQYFSSALLAKEVPLLSGHAAWVEAVGRPADLAEELAILVWSEQTPSGSLHY